MKLVVLPFNAAKGTSSSFSRQIANFAADIARGATGGEINVISYLMRVPESDGSMRSAYANVSESLLETEWIQQVFNQSEADRIVDGLLAINGDQFDLTIRVHERDAAEPIFQETWQFALDGLFKYLHDLTKLIALQTGNPVPKELEEVMDFGTDSPEAFLKFLEGFDSLVYVQQAEGQVTRAFSPSEVIDALLKAIEIDPNFVGPFDTLVQFCRACATYKVGESQMMKDALQKLSETHPEDYKPYLALSEVYASENDPVSAATALEKAVSLAPDEPALYSRLAFAQLAMNMPVNAERNLRKAMELEDPTKPSAGPLASILMQTSRAHEVPDLWKSVIDQNPQHSAAHAKYASALIAAGQVEEGERAFDYALEHLEDNLVVKRAYAPYLVQKNDLDRAMDFYEDCLDHAPEDVDVSLEYARTLSLAGRDFEIPRVLQQILAGDPNRNLRAQVVSWLIELEQPKRIESLRAAEAKMAAGDFQTALRELKPLRNWLADYWRFWLLLSGALAHEGEFAEAEEAARKLIDIFPACEPAYSELANALNGQGKAEEAYDAMRRAAENLPSSLSVQVSLALAAKRSGRADEARNLARHLREVVGPNPDMESVFAEIEA